MKKVDLEELDIIEESVDNYNNQGFGCGTNCVGVFCGTGCFGIVCLIL